MSSCLGLIYTSSVLTDQLPALKTATNSEMIRKNLNALHAAMENVIEAVLSEKIWRSLSSSVRTYVDKGFVTGNTIMEYQTAKEGMALIKYWVKMISVY